MKNRTDTSAQKPEDLLNELRQLVAEAEKMMGEATADGSGELLANLRTRFEDAQERFSDLYANARKKVVAGAKYTDATIRANPYQALAIALGAGLLAGVLLGRRSK